MAAHIEQGGFEIMETSGSWLYRTRINLRREADGVGNYDVVLTTSAGLELGPRL